MSEDARKIFLTARWENLILVTYKTDPDFLKPYLPEGLELDTIDGSAFLSLVAFDFIDTKVKGIYIPFNVNFPEINLRFYVKNKEQRGVVFVREFVPNHLTVIGANIFFNENYKRINIKNEISIDDKIFLMHTIEINSKEYFIKVLAENKPYMPPENSAEHFFKEHEWGFGTTRSGKTLVYRVEHPYWEVYPVTDFETNIDYGEVYGNHWKFLNGQKPYNITLAKGSAIKVFNAE
jgi:uncharacterized protein YqjF (DUF2071 family)